jgi:glycosyltransferase involved in cell wall biosynthesis
VGRLSDYLSGMPKHERVDPLLRAELQRLVLENQDLHRRLRRLERPSFLFRRLVTTVSRQLRARAPWATRRAHAAPQPDPENFPPTFRPYQVRRRLSDGKRPRVLHAIANLYTGGSARLVVDLVENLDEVEHHLVVRTTPPRPHYVGLDVEEAPKLSGARQALGLLRRLRPDLIHVHFLGHHRNRYGQGDWDWYEPLFSAAEVYGCPVVENVNIPVAPYFSDAVRCYVFVSDYVRTLFGRAEDRNLTIYPGSDVDLFSRRSAQPKECIGMVYRLEADKLDETAIDVFIDVVRRRPKTTAIIVGGGRFLEPYRARVQAVGLAEAFTFTAYVAYEDLPRVYEQMSVFVAPPHSESFGHVVPLAMSMRIPVVAYAVGALPEILEDDRVLAAAGDIGALAGKAVELLDDEELRFRIGAANRDRAESLFSVEKMASDYRALYAELLP